VPTDQTTPGLDTDRPLDAAGWVRRWEEQQAGYVTDRAAMFDRMLDVIDRLDARPGALLDLGCGPGSLAGRAVRRWPGARVVGLELDPVMLELGRRTLGDAVRWVPADLREPDWPRRLPETAFDAVVSATALHWLEPEHLGTLVTGLAGRMRPGGVFVNYDKLAPDPGSPRLAALSTALRAEQEAASLRGREDWAAWWSGLAAEPALAGPLAERERLLPAWSGAARGRRALRLGEFTAALRDAGFAEVDTLNQVNDRRLLVAIR
jgi:SAM-dependent methyltransferase